MSSGRIGPRVSAPLHRSVVFTVRAMLLLSSKGRLPNRLVRNVVAWLKKNITPGGLAEENCLFGKSNTRAIRNTISWFHSYVIRLTLLGAGCTCRVCRSSWIVRHFPLLQVSVFF
jgi:hypothetical protein